MGATIYFVPSSREIKTRVPQALARKKKWVCAIKAENPNARACRENKPHGPQCHHGEWEEGLWRVQVAYGEAPNRFLRSGYYASITQAKADLTAWKYEWLESVQALKTGAGKASEDEHASKSLRQTFEKYKLHREAKRKESVQAQGREWSERDVEMTTWDQRTLNRLMKAFGAHLDLPLRKISKQHVSDWRDALLTGDASAGLKPIKGVTVRRQLNMLQAMFRTARDEWGWWPEDKILPMAKIRKSISKGKARDRFLKPGELERLIEASGLPPEGPVESSEHVAMLAFLLACHTAMRAGEMRSLRPGMIHLKARYAHLEHTKNNEPRIVPLDDMAVQIIQRLIASMPEGAQTIVPLTRNALTRAFIRIKRRAKIKNLRFHDSRAEGTKWLANFYDVMDLRKYTGHKDLNTLMGYYRTDPVELAKRMIGQGVADGPVKIEKQVTLPGGYCLPLALAA